MIVRNKIPFIRYGAFFVALSIMTFIFCMSAQNAESSNGVSGGFIRSIAPYINWNYKNLSALEKERFVAGLQFIVRKGAHFSIYTLLGASLSVGMFTFERLKNLAAVIISFVLGALYAVSDEIHQKFVSGRSCELRDMFIDWSGTLLGCLIVLFFVVLIKRKKARRN